MEKLVEQAPAIGAIVFIVIIFIGYLKSKDQVSKEQQTELIGKLDRLGDIIQDNTKVMKEHNFLSKNKGSLHE